MSEQPEQPRKKRRRFFTLKNKRHMPNWLAWLLAGVMKAIAWTYRVRVIDPEGVLEALERGEYIPSVACIWHNRLLFYAPILGRKVLKSCAVLISASRDGEYITTFEKCFGLSAVRGSSSKGGREALHQLVNTVRNERKTVILTIDGPRGPKYTVHPGAVLIAKRCGAPIFLSAINARHKWQLRSWDRMQIPVPFSQLELRISESFVVPPEMSIEEGCEKVREELLKITVD